MVVVVDDVDGGVVGLVVVRGIVVVVVVGIVVVVVVDVVVVVVGVFVV